MRKLLLFAAVILLPAVIVGISNLTVFPDSAWAATLMLVTTVAISAIFTWQSGEATPKIARYCIVADFIIAAILCVNLGSHWLLAREVSAAKQGVVERHTRVGAGDLDLGKHLRHQRSELDPLAHERHVAGLELR